MRKPSRSITPSIPNATVGSTLEIGAGGTLGTAAYTAASDYEPALGNPDTNGFVLSSTTTGTRSWIAISGAGTVTSVGLSVPSGFNVANSPITTRYAHHCGDDNPHVSVKVTAAASPPLPRAPTTWAPAGSGAALTGITASQVTFTQTGKGAMATTLDAVNKNRPINVKTDFGAVGDDLADDTSALQAALDSAKTQQRAVYIPRGTPAKITSALIAYWKGMTIFGDGMDLDHRPADCHGMRLGCSLKPDDLICLHDFGIIFTTNRAYSGHGLTSIWRRSDGVHLLHNEWDDDRLHGQHFHVIRRHAGRWQGHTVQGDHHHEDGHHLHSQRRGHRFCD